MDTRETGSVDPLGIVLHSGGTAEGEPAAGGVIDSRLWPDFGSPASRTLESPATIKAQRSGGEYNDPHAALARGLPALG